MVRDAQPVTAGQGRSVRQENGLIDGAAACQFIVRLMTAPDVVKQFACCSNERRTRPARRPMGWLVFVDAVRIPEGVRVQSRAPSGISRVVAGPDPLFDDQIPWRVQVNRCASYSGSATNETDRDIDANPCFHAGLLRSWAVTTHDGSIDSIRPPRTCISAPVVDFARTDGILR